MLILTQNPILLLLQEQEHGGILSVIKQVRLYRAYNSQLASLQAYTY